MSALGSFPQLSVFHWSLVLLVLFLSGFLTFLHHHLCFHLNIFLLLKILSIDIGFVKKYFHFFVCGFSLFSFFLKQVYSGLKHIMLKWICSTFVVGHRRFLHHHPVDGLLQYIYIPVLFWNKNLVNYGSNEPGKKNPLQKTFFELSDKILKVIILW